jgi:hypothetical protein
MPPSATCANRDAWRARRPVIMSTNAMSSGQAGSQAPHSVHESIDAARSSVVAPCCKALARPCGV